MTREELSQEEYSFSRVIVTCEEEFYREHQPFETNLEAYYQELFQLESIPSPIIKEPEPLPTPEELRHQVLDDVLKKLSSIEIDGKEHIEEYLRHQYCCFFQGNTIRNSYNALSYFIKFMNGSGKCGIHLRLTFLNVLVILCRTFKQEPDGEDF